MRRSLTLIALLLASLSACQIPGCPRGQLELTPRSAHPGDKVLLHQKNAGFQSFDSLRVLVGRDAAYARVTGNNDAEVMVPIRAATGNVPVRIFDGTRLRGTAPLTVLEPRCVRLVMGISATGLKVIGREPCADAVTRDVPSLEERISFDAVDGAGHLLHTGSVVNPLKSGRETFARGTGTASAERIPPSTEAVFWVQIPNLPQLDNVRFYSVPRGVSLADSLGRQDRVPIQLQSLPQGFRFRIGP